MAKKDYVESCKAEHHIYHLQNNIYITFYLHLPYKKTGNS